MKWLLHTAVRRSPPQSRSLFPGEIVVVCLGCDPGYTGVNCKTCLRGHYRLEAKCTKCPKAAYMLIFVYAGGIGKSRFE